MDSKKAQQIIKQNKRSYNEIAEDFSRTRGNLWSELKKFKQYVSDEDRILDVGCGNGRLSLLFKDKDVQYVGVDNSEELIKIARKRNSNYDFQKGTIFDLPFSSNKFDKVFTIAVLHHIPSEKYRIKSLSELYRVLKSSGKLILTTWSKTPFNLFLFRLKGWLRKVFANNDLEPGDYVKKWGGQKELYYHFYTKKELVNLIKKAGFKVIDSGRLYSADKRRKNLYVVAQK